MSSPEEKEKRIKRFNYDRTLSFNRMGEKTHTPKTAYNRGKGGRQANRVRDWVDERSIEYKIEIDSFENDIFGEPPDFISGSRFNIFSV